MHVRRWRGLHGVAGELRRVPLLDSVPDRELARLAKAGTRRRFAEGEVIVAEGEAGSAFYVLLSGCAAVSVDGELIGGLHGGDTFGEIGALGDRTRTATVVAATDAECFVLASWHFRGFLSTHSGVAFALARRLAGLASRHAA
jgi:CRP-like cAMP-binding protein